MVADAGGGGGGGPTFPFHPTMQEVTKQKQKMGVSFRRAFVFSARCHGLILFEIVHIPESLVDDVV